MNTNYRGLVIDRTCNQVIHRTKIYTSWEVAHHAAEQLARRHGLYHYDWVRIDVETDTRIPKQQAA